MTSDLTYSFAVLRNQLTISGTLIAQTALRIGAGRSSDVSGSDLPVLRDARGRPFIPGASLKGALRARVEALMAGVQPGEVRDLQAMEKHQQVITAIKEAHKDSKDDQVISRAIWATSNLIELTFGAQWTASRLFFKDALVDEELWFGQFEVRNGVGIDRDTETVSGSLLYNYEVVPAGTRFHFMLSMENAAPWQLGMLTLALKPWQRGEAQIGGFRSRGLGHIKLDMTQCDYRELHTVDDLLGMLDGQNDAAVSEAQLAAWRDEFRKVLSDPASVRREENSNA